MEVKYEFAEFVASELAKGFSLNVLDLGCGEGKFLFAIYDNEKLDFGLLKGVDSGISEGRKPWPTSDLNENYRSYSEHNRKLVKNAFEYELVDISEYLNKETNKYDLIILSNILHNFNWKAILSTLKKCERLLTKSGVIYLNAANSNHPYSKEENKTTLNEEKLMEIKNYFQVVKMRENESHYELIIGSKLS